MSEERVLPDLDIWHDDEGVWRQIGGVLYGPFQSEEEAERARQDARVEADLARAMEEDPDAF